MHLRSLSLLFFSLALSCSAIAAPKLLVISVSGFDARYLAEADRLKIKIPNTLKLMKRGASSSFVVSAAPSETWPMYATLVTGMTPSDHGVLGNNEAEGSHAKPSSLDSLNGPTLWQEASKAHLKTALVFWPGTVGAQAAFNFPAFRDQQSGYSISFEPIAGKAVPPGIVDKVERMFPSFQKQIWDDSSSAYAAMYLLQKENPDVVLVRMADLDTEQHETAAMSVYAREILETGDEWIGQMLAKLSPNTVVALVSDHGAQNENYIVRPNVMLQSAKVPGKAVVSMGLIGTEDKTAAEYLRKLVGNRKYGIAREVPMAEVKAMAPELRHWTAAFDTFADTVASDQSKGPMLGPGTHHGVHGFWPTHRDYRSVFMIAGEGIRPKKLGEIDILDIAPTLADVIGVKLPQAKHKSLWPSLIQ